MAEQFYKKPSQKELEGFSQSIFHFFIQRSKILIHISQKTRLISSTKVIYKTLIVFILINSKT